MAIDTGNVWVATQVTWVIEPYDLVVFVTTNVPVDLDLRWSDRPPGTENRYKWQRGFLIKCGVRLRLYPYHTVPMYDPRLAFEHTFEIEPVHG